MQTNFKLLVGKLGSANPTIPTTHAPFRAGLDVVGVGRTMDVKAMTPSLIAAVGRNHRNYGRVLMLFFKNPLS